MGWTQIIWDPTPGGNVEHVEEHDLTTDDVDYVLETLSLQGSANPAAGHVFLATHQMTATSLSFTKKLMKTQ